MLTVDDMRALALSLPPERLAAAYPDGAAGRG
jgi:hypothetical protein